MMAAICAAPLAFSAPGFSLRATQFLGYLDMAYGSFQGANAQVYFWAGSYDDADGVAQGEAGVYIYDYYPEYRESSIVCSGPAYANIAFVNAGTGNAGINVVLDPDSSDCGGYNVTDPVVIALTGQADGYYHSMDHSNGTYRYGEETTSYAGRYDEYSEVFTGSVRDITGPFAGYAINDRRNELKRVKP